MIPITLPIIVAVISLLRANTGILFTISFQREAETEFRTDDTVLNEKKLFTKTITF